MAQELTVLIVRKLVNTDSNIGITQIKRGKHPKAGSGDYNIGRVEWGLC